MHFAIHLNANTFLPNPDGKLLKGLIHFSENYKSPINQTKYISRKKRPFIVISVEIPINKPNSLLFKLTPPENETNFKFSDESIQDAQLFIDILNEYFDETNIKYINSYYVNKHPHLNRAVNILKKAKATKKNMNYLNNKINKTRVRKNIPDKNLTILKHTYGV